MLNFSRKNLGWRALGQRARLAGAADPADERDLVRRLDAHQLRTLLRALDTKDPDAECVPAPPDAPLPHVPACRGWRWPDLGSARELRPLPHCRLSPNCCNPYHWSRLSKPETPPPPYCRFAMDDKIKPEDRAPSEDSRRTDHERLQPGSLTTDGEDKFGRGWCKLAYWELTERVGPQYPVEIPAVNVFSALPRGDGLCLDTLARGAASSGQPSPDNIARTRAKIGLGVTLSMESDGVWVYNRSEQPIFVNSPTLDDTDTRTLLVYKVPSGHCLCIFDPVKASEQPPPHWTNYGSNPTGPIDRNSVRISFAKGWGPKYSRQDVTSCPCWLELLLKPRR